MAVGRTGDCRSPSLKLRCSMSVQVEPTLTSAVMAEGRSRLERLETRGANAACTEYARTTTAAFTANNSTRTRRAA